MSQFCGDFSSLSGCFSLEVLCESGPFTGLSLLVLSSHLVSQLLVSSPSCLQAVFLLDMNSHLTPPVHFLPLHPITMGLGVNLVLSLPARICTPVLLYARLSLNLLFLFFQAHSACLLCVKVSLSHTQTPLVSLYCFCIEVRYLFLSVFKHGSFLRLGPRSTSLLGLQQ